MKKDDLNRSFNGMWFATRFEIEHLFCACTVEWMASMRPSDTVARTRISSVKDCSNCLGYGIMPIPWTEVK